MAQLTAKETFELLGRKGRATLVASTSAKGSVLVDVEILDVRGGNFGRTDYRVKPLAGSGDMWMSGDKVELLPKEES